uniref:Uncharacterized protein n=1 Tax=Oncorhynchus mykiss TaxID=8022 RepID=A0A8C7VH82_ONCMY
MIFVPTARECREGVYSGEPPKLTLPKEERSCPVCHDIFRDPVILPENGHSLSSLLPLIWRTH